MVSAFSRRLTKGILANTFGQGVNLFIQLLGVPMFLFFWGANLYGEWLVLFAIPAYLSLSDIGFATATTHQMTILAVNGKKSEAISVFHSASLLVLAVSSFFFLLILVAVYLVPVSQWFSLSQIGSEQIRSVLLLLSLQVLVGLQTSVLFAGFSADGQYGLGTLFFASIRLFEFSLLALALVLGGGPVAAAGAFLSGRVIGFGIMKWTLHRKISWIESGYRRANRETIVSLWRPSIAFMGFPLGNFFSIQGLILIVGATWGPIAVVIFTSLRTLTKITTQIVSSVNSSVRPEVSRAYGEKNIDLLRELYRRSTQVSVWCAALLVSLLGVFGSHIADFWTAGRVQVSFPFFGLLLATVFVNSIWWGSLNILYGTNNHQRLAIIYIIVNAGFISLSYPLLLSYNISGAAFCLLAIEIVLAIYTIGCATSLTEEKLGRLFAEVIRPPIFLFDQVKAYFGNK